MTVNLNCLGSAFLCLVGCEKVPPASSGMLGVIHISVKCVSSWTVNLQKRYWIYFFTSLTAGPFETFQGVMERQEDSTATMSS